MLNGALDAVSRPGCNLSGTDEMLWSGDVRVVDGTVFISETPSSRELFVRFTAVVWRVETPAMFVGENVDDTGVSKVVQV